MKEKKKKERLTELMKSRRAALASPSLAGASICTPTASSLISTFHIHPKQEQKKNQSINTDPKYNNVYVCVYIIMAGPVMEEDLEPGLAWMVIATEDGGIDRIQDGKLWLGGFAEEDDD